MTDDPGDPGGAPVTGRELAVRRSLDPARMRAEQRVQRFLDAAFELMEAGSGKEFTVQEVVERSGQSLRSFYQYFGGKQALLLAVFEETVRSTADELRNVVAREDDALERLRRLVLEYYRQCRTAPKTARTTNSPAPVIVEFAQQLLTAHPAEAARAFAPLSSLFGEILGAAASAGAVRADLRSRSVIGVLLEVIMFNAFSSTIAGSAQGEGPDAADDLWDLILHGIRASSAT